MTIDQFERQIMSALLAGDDPILETLRQQYAAATVRGRESKPSGFSTYFDVPSSVPPIDRKLLHLDDLQVELAGAATPADTSVHVENGRLRSLECFVYDGAFPESPEIRAAWYYGTEKFDAITPELLAARDVEELLEDDD
jgi:glyoxylase-like metal-dependent hydrolase (beta-lactamase superfamily II)